MWFDLELTSPGQSHSQLSNTSLIKNKEYSWFDNKFIKISILSILSLSKKNLPPHPLTYFFKYIVYNSVNRQNEFIPLA